MEAEMFKKLNDYVPGFQEFMQGLDKSKKLNYLQMCQEFLFKQTEDMLKLHENDLYWVSPEPLPAPKDYQDFKSTLENLKKKGNDELTSESNMAFYGNERSISYYTVALEYYRDHKDAIDVPEECVGELNRLLSIICCNASLGYFKLHEIGQSFNYSNKAIEFDTTFAKGHYRRGICFQKFVDFEASNIEFKLAMGFCQNDKTLYSLIESEYRQQEEKIKKMLGEKENIKARIESDKQFQEFPVHLTWRSDVGRCIVAKENVKPGSVLLRVAPFTHALIDECELSYCGSCSRPLKSIDHHNCRKCQRHVLCNRCQNDEIVQKNHNEECDILHYLTKNYPDSQSRDFRFMLRLVLAARRNRDGLLTKENCPPIWKQHPYIFDTYQDLLNLSRNQNQIEKKQMDAFKRGVDSIFAICQIVKGNDYLKGVEKSDILNAYSIIQLNGHEVLHPLHDSNGFGIYPTASYLNHSCEPNSCWYFDENGMICIANFKEIKKDEEITITYIDTTYPLNSRRKDLLETYHFFCKCTKCVRDADGRVGVNCLKCQTPLLYKNMEIQLPESKYLKEHKYYPILKPSGRIFKCQNCNSQFDASFFMHCLDQNMKEFITKKSVYLEKLFGTFNTHYNKHYHDIRSEARENNDIDTAIIWTRKILRNYEALENVYPWSTLGTYYYLLRYLKKQNKSDTLNEREQIIKTIKSSIENLIDMQSYFFSDRILHKLKIQD
ncbi:hypothetical protein DLAC_07965 [Tieghemostelium lacteum]|uniref:SET domain-containing protein n=1 Tax=Tieghemostelium lacteum TaxID=361077 RepID=A0A151ZAS8_TIELA|nr:hypothetical protein DLAC_07965 [Tieghemostelium lacteum]|eukprot:KYQ91062.1 hypothetical protein DLAC_07965 [Tieghemostelium lacteum]